MFALLIYVTDERPAATASADRQKGKKHARDNTVVAVANKTGYVDTSARQKKAPRVNSSTDFNQTGYMSVSVTMHTFVLGVLVLAAVSSVARSFEIRRDFRFTADRHSYNAKVRMLYMCV